MFIRSAWRVRSVAAFAIASAGLSACAVVGSAPVFDDQTAYLGCQSTLGSYALPRTVLNIQISKVADQSYYVLEKLDTAHVPDNKQIFCLDHLRSPAASDEVRVFKNKITAASEEVKDGTVVVGQKRKVSSIDQTTTPYLQLIASKAVDHTAGIIRRIIRLAFILISNKGDFSPARSTVGPNTSVPNIVADFQIDPFDYQEMASVNRAVRKYGFCFVLEDYTFNRTRHTGATAEQYCNAPAETARDKPPLTAKAVADLHYLTPKPVNGIFFRPRASYRLSVYTNGDPDGRGNWKARRTKSFLFENIMPVVSVGVDRTAFATRRTGLVFDDGMLTNVCISKGSEIEGAIQIPLEVIYGLVALPSETLTAAINDATTAKQLADARQSLINAQNNYVNFLKDSTQTPITTGGTFTTDDPKALTLNSSTTSPTFTNDDPPDAGEIYKADGTDALAQICVELLAAKTSTGGTF